MTTQPWRQKTASQIRDAAFRAVYIAAGAYRRQDEAYRREVIALTAILSAARLHGLTTAELVKTSGLDEEFITRLLRPAGLDEEFIVRLRGEEAGA